MKKLTLSLFTAMLLVAQTAEFLRDEVAHSARQYALGGTSVASNASPVSVYANPALLTDLSAFTFHSVTLFNNTSEDRKYPAYSAFDSRNANEVYASTDLSYTDFNFAISGEFKINDLRFVGAFSRLRAYDHNYFYREVVRKNSAVADYLMGAQIYENKGEVYANTLGFATALRGLQVGLSFSFYTMSEFDQSKEIRLSEDATENDYFSDAYLASINRISLELDNTPLAVSIGAVYPVIDQLKLGVNYRSGYTAELRGTGANWDYEIPSVFAVGLEYYGANALAAKFTFDYEFVGWSDLKIKDIASNATLETLYGDVHRYKVGMEHRVGKNANPLRVGAIFENTKSDPDVHKTTFTLGTTVKAAIFDIDLAMGYSYLSYNERDLFEDSIWKTQDGTPFQERVGLDTVDQSFLNFMIDLTYNFEL